MSLQHILHVPASTFSPALAHNLPDRDAFWRFADAAKRETEALAAQKMQRLPQLPVEALRLVCTQYRFFTIDYIRDLSLLLAELPFGGLRSLLATILSEELGEGDADKAHPLVYDRFLASIGVATAQRETPLPANRAILGALTGEMSARSPAFGIGLRGMGGECLCQTYLSVLHAHVLQHPWIRANAARIDWEFWTIHTGEIDLRHGELTRQAIDDYLLEAPDALADLAQGYQRSITAWNRFWQNIFDAATVLADTRA